MGAPFWQWLHRQGLFLYAGMLSLAAYSLVQFAVQCSLTSTRPADVQAIEERISTFTMTPHENGEMLQILR